MRRGSRGRSRKEFDARMKTGILAWSDAEAGGGCSGGCSGEPWSSSGDKFLGLALVLLGGDPKVRPAP
jgi:hypothetical protein